MTTFTEIMSEAAACETEEEAQALLDRAAEQINKEYGIDVGEARETTLANIAYGSGYFDTKTAQKILRVFKTEHPYFGTFDPPPTPEQAFAAGIKAAEEFERKREEKAHYGLL